MSEPNEEEPISFRFIVVLINIALLIIATILFLFSMGKIPIEQWQDDPILWSMCGSFALSVIGTVSIIALAYWSSTDEQIINILSNEIDELREEMEKRKE